jgi:hypothetical protein
MLKMNSKLGHTEIFPIKLEMTIQNKPEKTHEKITE